MNKLCVIILLALIISQATFSQTELPDSVLTEEHDTLGVGEAAAKII